MHEGLAREFATYEKRTVRSHQAHQKAMLRMPLGVSSNFRSFEPYPMFIDHANGVRVVDLDGNEYLDFNLCFGALLAGHCHPAVVRAVQERLQKGTMFGMPHTMEYELADEICARYPVEHVRFGNSGTEVTMHAIRLARGYTDRDKIIKMEGCYHGVHDAVMVSMKPKADKWGPADAPTQVPASAGIPAGTLENTLVAVFNDLPSARRQFEAHPGQVAALIVEPVPMNIGICMPEDGYLQGLRDLCTQHGALLIFDEVKTGASLAPEGASQYFGVKPDIVCLAKSIGGGFPLAAFGTSKDIMDTIATGKVFHAGTYNTNPAVMAAGLATLREVLTPDNYDRINRHSQRLVEGHQDIIRRSGLTAYAVGVCANGAVMLYPKVVKNYRDWVTINPDLWRQYWFGMVNRGVIPTPYWWDEQWTISVVHTDADIERHLATFEEVAPGLAAAQKELSVAGARA